MDEVSENHVIGSFLYGLGLQIGLNAPNRKPLRTYVGNNQTLQLDECYADVILKNASLLRIIEFKRQAKRRDYKEAAKLMHLEEGLTCDIWSEKDRKMLHRVSRTIHLYVESSKDVESGHSIRALPYLDMRQVEDKELLTLSEFIRGIALQATDEPIPEEERKNYELYLSLLCTCRGSKGAALVIYDTSGGGIACEVIEDLREIIIPSTALADYKLQNGMKLDKGFERKIAIAMSRCNNHVQDLRIKKELVRRHELELSVKQGISRSIGLHR